MYIIQAHALNIFVDGFESNEKQHYQFKIKKCETFLQVQVCTRNPYIYICIKIFKRTT